jgi:hypothetical protein
MRALAVLVPLLAVGCGGQHAIPSVRYANQPAVEVVNDRRDVKNTPGERKTNIALYHFDGSFFRIVTRPLELPRQQRARGINALDEVPDSTWFTNRIGVRDLTPEEVALGANRVGSPEDHKPWTIKSTKVGGQSVGFIIEDARGKKFLLKFDRNHPPGGPQPEIETANQIITGKLLHAIGFNTTDDYVVYLNREDLVLAKDAKVKNWHGTVGPLTADEVDRQLARVVKNDDGTYRGMASLFIAGKPIGGHAAEGIRADDPNDRIPHELRRDLRGMRTFFSWLDHTDVKEDNSLDAWTEDPEVKDRHYVKHYMIDFGGSLGAAAVFSRNPRLGRYYMVDFKEMFKSLLSLGMGGSGAHKKRKKVPLRGVGMLDAKYDVGKWRPETPAYIPFRTADKYDNFWAAKIIMRFTPEQIRAAVEMGRFTDPKATDYVVETLVERQRHTARYWFWRVSPLDRFDVSEDTGMCFDDLMLTYKLADVAGDTRYEVQTFDRAGKLLAASREVAAERDGQTCTGPLALATAGEGYTIVRIETTRKKFTGTTFVHVAREPSSGRPRVIGIWRK